MEDKKIPRTSSSSAAEAGRAGPRPTHQEVPDPVAISLDSLLYQGPEDEGSYQKGEGPSSTSDNNELDNVLDSFLDASTPGGPLPWSDFVSPELADIPVTNILNSTVGKKTFSASPTTEEVSVWTEATKDLMPPKGKDRATLEGVKKDVSPGKSSSCAVASTSRSFLPPEIDFMNVPILPLNPVYIAARARQILDVEGSEQKSSSPSITHTSQHLVTYANPQSSIKQSSYFYPENQPDAKIKKEGTEMSLHTPPMERSQSSEYGLTPQQPSTPDPENSLDFILYKNQSTPDYDSLRSTEQGKAAEISNMVLPSTSNAAQTTYQPMSLNGHQQLGYQTVLKESYLSQIQLPYIQFMRSDPDTDQGTQFSFETFPQKICLICGDEASGCHYGVLTCGSCKVFFKRAIEGQHTYLCAGRNDCIVDKIRRKNCPSCRLRKCCQAGMVLGGRKFKKFSRVKTGREINTIVFSQPTSLPVECQQALTQRISSSSAQEIQYIPELLHILQSIEPEVVYAGYDNTQPETPSALLSSLNQLCERQLLCVVKWSKSLPGFRNLHIDDQITLLQYSWMSLMVFAMGWRSYKHVSGQMLYFAPDLILNEQRMKESSFYSLCLSMWQLPQEFVKLQVSHEEFLCMKALLLLNTIPLEGLKSQGQFDEMRSNYIRELAKAIGLRHKGVVASSQRFYQLTKLMDSMHELVKQLHLYCLNTFLQSRALSVEFPEMMSEVISAQLPKILAGMVKPLVFHKK